MLTINPQPTPKAIVFWLHGLGADQNDFVDFINLLNLKQFTFILPNAISKFKQFMGLMTMLSISI